MCVCGCGCVFELAAAPSSSFALEIRPNFSMSTIFKFQRQFDTNDKWCKGRQMHSRRDSTRQIKVGCWRGASELLERAATDLNRPRPDLDRLHWLEDALDRCHVSCLTCQCLFLLPCLTASSRTSSLLPCLLLLPSCLVCQFRLLPAKPCAPHVSIS